MSPIVAMQRKIQMLILAAIITCAAISRIAVASASETTYRLSAPVNDVTYSDAQKEAQLAAGIDQMHAIRDAVQSGVAIYTVPRGVYRLPSTGDDSLLPLDNAHNFTLSLAGCEIIMTNSGCIAFPHNAVNLKIVGPVKLDADPIPYSEGIITAYDPATGSMTMTMIPGYDLKIKAEGVLDAFSAQGVWIEQNFSYGRYSGYTVVDAEKRTVNLNVGKGQNVLYAPGNMIGIGHAPFLINTVNDKALTISDVDYYTGGGILWGGGDGNWSITRVRGMRRPGTNRLYSGGGCQAGLSSGNLTFTDCEFGNTEDDILDWYGTGFFTCYKMESKRTAIFFGGNPTVGDKINSYSLRGFHPLDEGAVVTAVEPIGDPAMQADATRIVKDVIKARAHDWFKLNRVTFDQDVSMQQGDYLEEAENGRPGTITIQNCYFHDSAVRVMAQGFRHAIVKGSRFDRISGGLTLCGDTWWWEGPTIQDIDVENNTFTNTTYRNTWGVGPAAINVTVGSAFPDNSPTGEKAIHGVRIKNNTIVSSSCGAINVQDAQDVVIAGNKIRSPYRLGKPSGVIKLTDVRRANVQHNVVYNFPGPFLEANSVGDLDVAENQAIQAMQNGQSRAQSNFLGVFDFTECQGVTMTGNSVNKSDSAVIVAVKNSSDVTLKGNTASETAPDTKSVDIGSGVTNFISDDEPLRETMK